MSLDIISSGAAGGGGSTGGGSGVSAGGGDQSYQSPEDLTATYASATTLALTDLPFSPVTSQFHQVVELDASEVQIAVYDIDDLDLAWGFAAGADKTTGTLTVTGAAFDAASTFTVVIRGPMKEYLDLMSDLSGLNVHISPTHFAAAWASATTLDLTAMEMDPTLAEFRAVVAWSSGRVIATYTPRNYAFGWTPGATGEGVLAVTGATFQGADLFTVFIVGPEHGTKLVSEDAALTDRAKLVKPVDTQGNIITGGGGTSGGLSLYQSKGGEFVTAWISAEVVELQGVLPAVVNSEFAFVEVIAFDAAKALISTYKPETHAFTYDAATQRLTITGALMVTGGVILVSYIGASKTLNAASNLQNVNEQAPRDLRGDDHGIELITAAQALTTSMADVGGNVEVFGRTGIKFWITLDINAANNVRFQLLELHESGGAEEYTRPIETIAPTLSQIDPEVIEFNQDADQLMSFVFELDGLTPYVQLQAMMVTDGGADAEFDAVYYTRSRI